VPAGVNRKATVAWLVVSPLTPMTPQASEIWPVGAHVAPAVIVPASRSPVNLGPSR